MSEKLSPFAAAVQHVLEAVIFENWLRFYFISEKPNNPDDLYIAIPDQALQRIREQYPHMYPMALTLNAQTIDFETSRRTLCTFVATELDGKIIPSDMGPKVFDSSTFQTEMQLFNTWVQAHEDQLDRAFMDFGMWRSLFAAWRNSDAVKEWATQLNTTALHTLGSTPDKVSTLQ
ncbi:MAG: hypothetical protein RRY29_09175 [Desulfovibrionaceae bacterium]